MHHKENTLKQLLTLYYLCFPGTHKVGYIHDDFFCVRAIEKHTTLDASGIYNITNRQIFQFF